jgi:crotonobetainyl-CoA:carnitine CoA-transferase CaiB-like acyl-CoA transferase
MTAFGQDGPRGTQTAYDHAIQATSGIMAMTGTPEVNPLKTGAPVIDYSTGTMAAFAIASALFQRERTGSGQHIDCSMFDVALMLEASHIAGFMSTGKCPKPKGNSHAYASSYFYETKQGHIMLAASNHRQHTRLFAALGRPEMGHKDYEYRRKNFESEAAELQKILIEKPRRSGRIISRRTTPALRVRSMSEALADPKSKRVKILHRHERAAGFEGPMTVPMCAFSYEHGGRVSRRRRRGSASTMRTCSRVWLQRRTSPRCMKKGWFEKCRLSIWARHIKSAAQALAEFATTLQFDQIPAAVRACQGLHD